MAESSDSPMDVPTLAGVADAGRARRARNSRRIGVGLMLVVVVAACLGWLGPRDTNGSDEAGGASLDVTFPHLTRSGADSAIDLSIEAPGAGTVTVELPRTVFDKLGIESITPEPSSQTSTRDTVRLVFEEVPGDDFSVQLLGRIPVRALPGRFDYDLRVGAGPTTLEVAARTWVLP